MTNANEETVVAYAWSQFEDDWIVRAPAGVTEGQMTIDVTVYGIYEGEGNTVYYYFYCEGDGHI